MTYDDQYLITISEDTCIMIWKVQDRDGRNLKRDKDMSYAEEILITKTDLEDKVCKKLLHIPNCPHNPQHRYWIAGIVNSLTMLMARVGTGLQRKT